MNSNQIELRKIKESFFEEHPNLIEAIYDKDRGYGYISCYIEGNNFAIPLRSHIKHDYCFKTSTPPGSEGSKGLDYTKALVVDSKFLDGTFAIDNNQYQRILRNQRKIINDFSEYVHNYKKFKRDEEVSEYYSKAYRYTTLVNYHSILGIWYSL